jgi:hypothetical protein
MAQISELMSILQQVPSLNSTHSQQEFTQNERKNHFRRQIKKILKEQMFISHT